MRLEDDYGILTPAAREVADLVTRMFEAFARRDIDSTLALVAAVCTLDVPATAQLAGREGPYRGHDGLRTYFADLERVWDELVVTPESIRAAAGSAVTFGRIHARAGELVVDRRVAWMWRVEGGLVVSGQTFDVEQGGLLGAR